MRDLFQLLELRTGKNNFRLFNFKRKAFKYIKTTRR